MRIRVYGDPVLKMPASLVDPTDPSLRRLAATMLDVMREHDGIGLAAPQIGVSKRVFVTCHPSLPPVVCNPSITDQRGETFSIEGCLSFPEGFTWHVPRPAAVTLVGTTLDGETVNLHLTGLAAQVAYHATDHLNGVLLLNRLPHDQYLEALETLAAGTYTVGPQ